MPLLGQLPLDPRVAQACDEGTNIPTQEPDAAVTQAYKDIANKIKEYCDAQSQESHLTCSGSSSSNRSSPH
ncbi:hypothetical protein O3P69_019968 [Scylla paramamosain]|uniref:Uncharacterized protein n=1 Tax=Scylla paramamosain TaxID=85552 RepID=A0AAW0SFJ6_SCYPA